MLSMGAMAGLAENWQGHLLPMDDEQFVQWAKLLEQRAGISVSISRKAFVASKLRMRMRELGINNYQQYYDLVSARKGGAVEWQVLLNRLTIHETAFYRHIPSFQLLRGVFLPRFFSGSEAPYKLDIWSVGCATGEESYSLAILVDDFAQAQGLECYYGVTGTDISLQSLTVARKGIYQQQQVKGLDTQLVDKYFEPIGENDFQVTKGIRERMCFAQLNVQDVGNSPLGTMDVIFCQNLLIYFAKEQKLKILDSLKRLLKPGGLLVLGLGEMMGWSSPELQRVDYPDTCAYQRIQ